ncbi:hypothetical protein WA026_006849 [Henosepilachna vigintioctopunctata]|uniref:Uncharacterized protein n=1 Tax=Henosepilachna vigintioctopunctata TaxID=420089 RepID=A0AAW1UG78_9CUCU
MNLKNSNPRLVPYLDSTGNLCKSHDYSYQVQGLLHITRRSWCDFFVFTNVTFHVCRILRDDEFWKKIERKLAEFYLYYMLPELVDPKIPICKRSWMIEPIEDTALSAGAELSAGDNAISVKENLMDFKQSLFKIDSYPIGFSMPHANKQE